MSYKFEGELCKFLTQGNFLEIYGFLIGENDTSYIVQYPLTIIPRWYTDYREMMDEIISNVRSDYPDFQPVPLAPGFLPMNKKQLPSISYIPKASYIMIPMYEFAEEKDDINQGGIAIRQGFIDSIAAYYMLDITDDPDDEVKKELDKIAEEQEEAEKKRKDITKKNIVQTD